MADRQRWFRGLAPMVAVLFATVAGTPIAADAQSVSQGYVFGRNLEQQLGFEGLSAYPLPEPLPALAGLNVVDFELADYHAALVTADGALYTFGSNGGRLGNGEGAGWGAPKRVEALRDVHIVDVAVGFGFTIAVDADGQVYTFGSVNRGELGHGSRDESYTALSPRLVEALVGHNIVAVGAGRQFSFAIEDSGVLWGWGDNWFGQIGGPWDPNSRGMEWDGAWPLGRPYPTPVQGLEGVHVVEVSGGEGHTVVRTADGSVYTWGTDAVNVDFGGYVGHGDVDREGFMPRRVEALVGERAVQVETGVRSSAVVTADGDLYTFGYAGSGGSDLGHGNSGHLGVPRRVESLALTDVVRVAMGNSHGLALTAEGEVYGFGWNQYGQSGLGHREHVPIPSRIVALDDVMATHIGAGGAHSIVIGVPDNGDEATFTDVSGSAHREAIEAVADSDIAGGYSDDTFRPGTSVTRGQMAAFLQRALNLPTASDGSFTDVNGSSHRAAIETVAAAGIAGGFTDGTFRPGAPVTRGQMATFLQRALNLPAATDSDFSDVVDSPHRRAIEAVAAAGIAGGFTDGTFRPGAPVTRGQMATFLARAFDLVD